MLTLPEFPDCQVTFSTRVEAESATDWSTVIEIGGVYNGPFDFVASRGYRLWWTIDDDHLLERGMAMLERSSGEFVASEWTSTISVNSDAAKRFPQPEQVARISIAPFKIKGSKMSYEWSGTVARLAPFPRRPPEKSRYPSA